MTGSYSALHYGPPTHVDTTLCGICNRFVSSAIAGLRVGEFPRDFAWSNGRGWLVGCLPPARG